MFCIILYTSIFSHLLAEPSFISSSDLISRSRIGAEALKDVNILNDQSDILWLSYENNNDVNTVNHPHIIPVVQSTTNIEANHNPYWYGTIHGVPMLLVDLDESLSHHTPNFVKWLLMKEKEWTKLPENEHWPRKERKQVTSKYRWYNVLDEAIRDPQVNETAFLLKKIITDNFKKLQGTFLDAVQTLPPASQHFWKTKYSQVGVGLPKVDFSLDPSVWIECWLNTHRPTPGMDSLSMHEHTYPWHGYLLLRASPSNTTYLSPTLQTFFSLKNSNHVLVMLPGGIKHSVLPNMNLDPRISIAFDITYAFPFRGKMVSHPSVEMPSRMIEGDDANTWMKLLTTEETKKNSDIVQF